MNAQLKSSRNVQDTFTRAIVEIYKYLAENKGFIKVKDFANAIVYPQYNIGKIIDGERNYPGDSGKRALAADNLVDTYKVNRDYLKGLSKKMFTEPPPRYDEAVPAEAVKLNFRDAGEKKKLISQLEDTQERLAAAEQELAILRDKVAKYETRMNTDKKTDKTTDNN